MADLVHFVFSIGGMLCALLAGIAWMAARRSSNAPRRFLTVLVLTYTVLSIYAAPHFVATLLSRPYRPLQATDVPPGRTAVVILGSGSFMARDWAGDGAAVNDPVGAERVVEAVRVFHLINPEIIVSSGGSVGDMDPDAPGGEVMKDLLLQMGVPASRIVEELESQNTHDEAELVARMLAPRAVDHVIIVTSDYHMRRSLGTFRAQGIDAIPAVARNPRFNLPWNVVFLPGQAGISETQAVAHELFGLVYYTLRGWSR